MAELMFIFFAPLVLGALLGFAALAAERTLSDLLVSLMYRLWR